MTRRWFLSHDQDEISGREEEGKRKVEENRERGERRVEKKGVPGLSLGSTTL